MPKLRPGPGDRVTLDVTQMEWVEGGDTVWIHNAHGTVLRLKVVRPGMVRGSVTSQVCSTSPIPHADARVLDDIVFCLPPRPRKKRAPKPKATP